jgi:hypothetical protein
MLDNIGFELNHVSSKLGESSSLTRGAYVDLLGEAPAAEPAPRRIAAASAPLRHVQAR